MAFENGDNDLDDESEFDWSVYGDHEQQSIPLEGKDIIAIFIAALQTIFLPLVLLGVTMLIIGIIIGILFGG